MYTRKIKRKYSKNKKTYNKKSNTKKTYSKKQKQNQKQKQKQKQKAGMIRRAASTPNLTARPPPLFKNTKYYSITNIIHETSILGLISILESGELKTQLQRIKDKVSTPLGQGGPNRALLSHLESITDPKYYMRKGADGKLLEYDAHGIFFRVEFETKSKDDKPNLNRMTQDVAFYFYPTLLEQKKSWILNSTENNGMFLNELGVIGESPISGKQGITYDYTNIDKFPSNRIITDASITELLIYDNVDLSLLKEIKFKNKTIYDQYKYIVPHGIKTSVFNTE